MSGGEIKIRDHQNEGDHQVVVFTFIGVLDPEKVRQWNESIANLKRSFGSHLVGVTIKGETSSEEFMRRQKPDK
jgi:hypothetical protein